MRNFKYALFVVFSLFLYSCGNSEKLHIHIAADAGSSEELAAKELRRYFYQTTGELAVIHKGQEISRPGSRQFLVGSKDDPRINLFGDELIQQAAHLGKEDFLLRSTPEAFLIIGGSDLGTLYGVYHFAASRLGVGFYLHGDVIPDRKQAFPELSQVDEVHSPLFDTRGILPFHDFPEGPDWWDVDGYKAIFAQLPKMKMNFIGLHTYPQAEVYPGKYYQAEPLVWIGKEEDFEPDGRVKKAYPVLHFQTGHDTWGYAPHKTSDYPFGASMLFDSDAYGASYMKGISPWPHSDQENIDLFNEHGALIKEVFRFAGKLGIKRCLGTELPLAIPRELEPDFDPDDQALIAQYYTGLFKRIEHSYPIDYYWLWTKENWTWLDIPEQEVDRVSRDMQLAEKALKASGADFSLAMCGWVLGPERDRAEFDKLLSKEVPFSCINREVGWDYIEPAFKELAGRSKWAIPWMEDDQAMISTQLWVGRMRKDASDALRYGCNGLIGIHWRTRNISPNISALAKAAWEMGDWKDLEIAFPKRDLPAGDFYIEWAEHHFGPEVAAPVAEIYTGLDGGDFYDARQPFLREANLYRSSTWLKGPGGIHRNPAPWSDVVERFRFLDELEKLKDQVVGEGNRERFTYWLHVFRFEESMAHLGCVLGELDAQVALLKKNPEYRGVEHPEIMAALGQRAEASRLYGEVMHYMLETVSTTGELGMITNLENHNRIRLQMLSKHDALLEERSGLDVKKENPLTQEYGGTQRLVVPVVRSLLEAGEDFRLKLSHSSPESLVLNWKPLGAASYRTAALDQLERGVYEAVIPSVDLNGIDFEYFVELKAGGAQTVFPASAPRINQSVVVAPR